jgi:hypothetical protein
VPANASKQKHAMTHPTPFTLHIFVADGDPDGLRLVERTNWNGKDANGRTLKELQEAQAAG